MRRVALYLRVSTGEQDTERQKRDLRAWCERCGWSVVAVVAETASGGKADRKQRATLLAAAKRRELDAIVVTELSRWSRSTADLLSTLTTLADYKCSLAALNGADFDFATASGKLMLTVLGAVAEFERELIRERTRSGIAAARARGSKLGRRAGTTTTQDKWRDRIVRMKADGHSISNIARVCAISPHTVRAALKAT